MAEYMRLVRKVPLSSTNIIAASGEYKIKIFKEIFGNYIEIIRDAKKISKKYPNDSDLKEEDFESASNRLRRLSHWIGTPPDDDDDDEINDDE